MLTISLAGCGKQNSPAVENDSRRETAEAEQQTPVLLETDSAGTGKKRTDEALNGKTKSTEAETTEPTETSKQAGNPKQTEDSKQMENPKQTKPPKENEPEPAEPPKADEPKPAEPSKADEPKPAEPPKADEPKPAEPPKAEEPAPTEPAAPELEQPKSAYDYAFDMEAIRSDLIALGEGMGLTHVTADGGRTITPDNASWATPVTASEAFQGERLQRKLKDYVLSMPALIEAYGGGPMEYFTIYIEPLGGGSYRIYFLY